ncbi:hypothetical protein [uncultured Croceitalea sp.]|uniref:hypothetical protein n=1 Tax=uncultured Croceitalea sp. TaxID=1798908 RepID=UPI0033059C14
MKKIAFLLIGLLLCNCKSDVDILQEILVPSKVILMFPEPNEECTTGEIISEIESEVVFEWTAAEVGDSYQVVLTDLATGQESILGATTNMLPIRLSRGTPYSWNVTTFLDNSNNTTSSDTESFYNAGPGILSYIPFPANYVSPINNSELSSETTLVTLEWEAEDLDGDITGYDVYFGSNDQPTLFESNVVTTFLTAVSVTRGTTYYWRIITKDSLGNESSSAIFTFSISE